MAFYKQNGKLGEHRISTQKKIMHYELFLKTCVMNFGIKTRKLFILMSGIYGTDFIIAGDLLITYPTFSGRWDMKVKKETPPRAWF